MGLFEKVKRFTVVSSQSNENLENSNYGKFVVLDVETTGLNPGEHRIVELCLLTVEDGDIKEIWNQRFNPEGPVGKTEIHGITDADVADAPYFRDTIEELSMRIKDVVLVAHNARFDLAFLRAEFERSGIKTPWLPSICTLQASNYYQPHLSRRRLADCCEDLGIEISGAHSANGDSVATAKLFHYYLDPNKNPKPRLEDLELIRNPKSGGKQSYSSRSTNPVVRQRIEQSYSDKTQKISNSSYKELVKLLAACSLAEVLTTENFPHESAYLEKVIEFLSDGQISDSESAELRSLAEIYELSQDQINLGHKTLVRALALQALKDESVSVSEREELVNVAESLGLSSKIVTEIIKEAKLNRVQSLSQNLNALPSSWKLGDPLRVGQKVVFTGCDPEHRAKLESESIRNGVTIQSKVSAKTTFLITDGSYVGNKANDAAALGVRVVTPDEYELLLKYLQPALPQEDSKQPMKASSQSGAEGLNPSDVRAWAISQGIEVSPKGRIHSDVYEKYKQREL
jgi:DNA polymerase-3 subunit epsilon